MISSVSCCPPKAKSRVYTTLRFRSTLKVVLLAPKSTTAMVRSMPPSGIWCVISRDRHRDLVGLGAGALHGAADRLAHRLGIDDRLLVDGVLARGLGRISLDPVLPARRGQLDELHRRGGYVKSQERAVFALEKEHFLYPFQVFTPENDRPEHDPGSLSISALLN